jgi:hypothetical protein
LLGAYTRAKDDAMTLAFGGRGKRRLNRDFDVIGFVYPDYCYPSRKQGKKRKATASAISTMLKGKKIKVLTHRPRYIETARVPKLAEGTSSAAEPEYLAPASAKGESAEALKALGQEKAETVEVPKRPVEAKEKTVEEPELKESAGHPKTLSPPPEPELPKVSRIPAITPKRRMASVLDAVIESTKVQTPASKLDKEGDIPKKSDEVRISPDIAKAGPPTCTEAKPVGATLILEKESAPEKIKSPTLKALIEELDFIIRHASGKQCRKSRLPKPSNMPGI